MFVLRTVPYFDGGEPTGGDPGGEPQQPAGQVPAATDSTKDDKPGPVPYDRFQTVISERNDLRARLAEYEQQEKASQEAQLKEQGKYKDLLDQRDVELHRERNSRMRLEVALKKGLPVELAARLQGDTIEDMEADADSLLQMVKPASGPGVPPASRGGRPAAVDLSQLSPAQIREMRAKGELKF